MATRRAERRGEMVMLRRLEERVAHPFGSEADEDLEVSG